MVILIIYVVHENVNETMTNRYGQELPILSITDCCPKDYCPNSENQSDISISNENEEIDKDDKDIYSDYLKTLGKDCSDESFLEKISLSS